MKKKMIITVIVFALLSFLAFSLYKASQLKDLTIIKTTTINSSKENVFNLVKYLGNFPKWSPFLAQDPSQKYEVKGTDGTVGSQFHWNGNQGKDLGYQEIVKIDSFSYVGMKCDIQKPFVAKPTFEYSFAETTGGIVVTQTFKLQSSTIDAFFMWLFGAKNQMAATNQQGLDLLKIAAENQ